MSFIEKNSFLKIKFDRNSFIGFDKEEIEKSSTTDLLMIRKPVLEYLRSTKLKKRNANFMDVFKRINKELRARKILQIKDKKETTSSDKEKNSPTSTEFNSTHSQERDSVSQEKNENSSKNIFLCRKTYINLDIPSFFNDKKQKIVENGKLFSYNKKLNPNTKSINDKFNAYSYEKPNFFKNNNDDDLFESTKFDNVDSELKEIELRSVIFDEVTEDIFFTLDEY